MSAPTTSGTTLIIACGALAREVLSFIGAYGLRHMVVTCLPANLHNRPDRIPEAVREKIREARPLHERILVLYGDCGTAGRLDAVLAEEGVERIPGAHCYEFYTGQPAFDALTEQEPGTFFLTDFLVRHFERLVFKGLGLDRFPQLLSAYFGNYRKLVYLAQVNDPGLDAAAKEAALRLGLEYERRFTGIRELAGFLLPDADANTDADADQGRDHGGPDRRILA